MKSQSIEKIRKVYKREWLLIAIDAMDEATTTPVRGRLLAHSPRRQDIYEKSRHYSRPALVVYSEDRFPKGFAATYDGSIGRRVDGRRRENSRDVA